MAALESCPKHNMFAYLEKTDGNAEFQEIIDFITRISIHYALTAIFDAIQLMEDEGESSERPYEPQPTPSPPYPSEAQVEPQTDPSPRPLPIPDSILEGSGRNQRGQSSSDKSLSVTEQSKEVKALKAQVKRLKKKTRPFIIRHKAWLKAVKSKKHHKETILKTSKRRSVSKQRRKTIKSSKGAPTVPTNNE
ncbi:hypothetical protein Tco_0461339 [Tanacetum coccineum]